MDWRATRNFTGAPLIAFIAGKALVDPVCLEDFWWHLRMGGLVVETHSIPRAAAWTFTFCWDGRCWWPFG